MSKYINANQIHCIEELKKVYFTLAQELHPDHGGDAEEFKILNSEYQELFPRFKNIHKNVNPEIQQDYYESTKPIKECPDDFIVIVTALLKIKGIDVELCGRWLWISGNTYECKDTLKAMGCRWNSKKKMWSWHYKEDGVYYKRKSTPMETIREMYGSQRFAAEEERRQIAG